MRMDVDEDDARIVRSTIDLGQGLGLRVVAEGVETAQAWARLTRLGCDIAQGYFLSRPIPGDELAVFVALHRAAVEAAAV
jgi:EAL domain-containing protein (putative c-di-GMP-specific phosphodiesterase class I)